MSGLSPRSPTSLHAILRTAHCIAAALLFGAASCAAQEPPRPDAPAIATQDPSATLDPAAFDALLVEAREHEQKGDRAAAAAAYLRLHRARPGDASLAVKAGETLGAAGRLNDAVSVLIEARERFEAIAEVDTLLARTLLLKAEENLRLGSGYDDNVLGYFEQALALCEQIVEKHPGARDAHLMRAQTLYQLGRWDEAGRAAQAAAERFPSHPGPPSLLGQLAVQDCRAALIALADQELDDAARAAAAARRDAAAATARAAFERAVDLDPERSFPHRMLGNLAAVLGDVDAALDHYASSLALDPRQPPDPQWLAGAVSVEKREALFSNALERLREGAPDADRGVLLWYRSKAQLDAGQYAASLRGFEAALAANPEDLTGHYYAFLAAWWNDDRDAAAGHAAMFAKADPVAFADIVRALPDGLRQDVVAILRWMAADAREKGRADPCRDLNQVLAYTLRTADEWNNYALLCWEGGDYERAYEGYERALRVEPDSPQLLNDAGAVLQYHLATPENLALARQYYDRAIERADAVLEDASATAEQKGRARTARENARANIAELPK